MKEVILADEKDAGELLVVVGHHHVLGGALAEAEQGVDVLDAAKSLLPEFELDGDVELAEAGIEMTL